MMSCKLLLFLRNLLFLRQLLSLLLLDNLMLLLRQLLLLHQLLLRQEHVWVCIQSSPVRGALKFIQFLMLYLML